MEINTDKEVVSKFLIIALEQMIKSDLRITGDYFIDYSYDCYLYTEQEDYINEYDFKFSMRRLIKEDLSVIIPKNKIIDLKYINKIILKNKIKNNLKGF